MSYNNFIDIDLDCEVTDNYHAGHILLESLKKKRPGDICQIQGNIDESETYHSVLTRVVRLARGLQRLGLRPGDVLVLSGANHLDVKIPFFAGMMLGLPVAGADPSFKYVETKSFLELSRPRIVFCDDNNKDIFKKASEDLKLDTIIVSFKTGDLSMKNIIDNDKTAVEDFEPAVFDVDKIPVWLVSTSGTTGVPKLVQMSHKAFPEMNRRVMPTLFEGSVDDGKPKILLLISPVHWILAYIVSCAAILSNRIVLMTTTPKDIDLIIDLINKYRPNYAPASPTIYDLILQSSKPCDLTCLDVFYLGGSKVYDDLCRELKAHIRPGVEIVNLYGQTESAGFILRGVPDTPIGSCGRPIANLQVKLIDPDNNEITKPNVAGELVVKGLPFWGYYKNPEETALAFTEDGWLRTGDQMYRDADGNYYFVERIKMLIKYRTTHVIPTELESLIRTCAGVADVCVTSVEHPTDQQWPVAVVVRSPGSDVTAQQIKDLVAENLSDSKQLRGGVVFVDRLPLTATGKVARHEVKKLAETLRRE